MFLKNFSNNYLGHLRMRHVLVDDHALDQLGVLHATTDLGLNLDQLKVDVLPLDVGNGQDGLHRDLSHLPVALVNAEKNVTKKCVKYMFPGNGTTLDKRRTKYQINF